MRVLGKVVLIEKPVIENNTGLELDAATTAAREKEQLKKLTSLSVFAVGDEVTKISKGDKVLIDMSRIPTLVEFDDKQYMMLRESDILIIW